MLSLERCRRLLGSDCSLSAAELKDLRRQLYALARIVIEAALTSRNVTKPHGLEVTHD